jgi:hypothetical protein
MTEAQTLERWSLSLLFWISEFRFIYRSQAQEEQAAEQQHQANVQAATTAVGVAAGIILATGVAYEGIRASQMQQVEQQLPPPPTQCISRQYGGTTVTNCQ